MTFNSKDVDVKAPDFETCLASELERAAGVSAERFTVLDIVPGALAVLLYSVAFAL